MPINRKIEMEETKLRIYKKSHTLIDHGFGNDGDGIGLRRSIW